MKAKLINQTLKTKLEPATVDYISELIQDNLITHEEKLETIRGIIELEIEQGSTSTCTIDQSILELFKLASSGKLITETEESDSDENRSLPPPVTSGQAHETYQNQVIKKSILSAYATIEDDQENPTESTKLSAKELKAAKDAHQSMLDQQLKLLDLKSKTRKKVEAKMGGDPLLRPNLNAELVQHETKLKRDEAASKARAKAQKDKADLLKQRELQTKKKADARARASKGERKA